MILSLFTNYYNNIKFNIYTKINKHSNIHTYYVSFSKIILLKHLYLNLEKKKFS